VVGWQANPSDADQIYSAIYSRAQKLKSSTGAAATKPSSPVCKDALLSASSSVSSVSAREKRSSECVADNDPSVAEKRQRSAFLHLFTEYSTQLSGLHLISPMWGWGTPFLPLLSCLFTSSSFAFPPFFSFALPIFFFCPSLSTRIVPLRFQAEGRRRRPNLGLVCCVHFVLSVLLS